MLQIGEGIQNPKKSPGTCTFEAAKENYGDELRDLAFRNIRAANESKSLRRSWIFTFMAKKLPFLPSVHPRE